MRAFGRAVVYGAIGCVTDATFAAAHDLVRRRQVEFRTSGWMFPIYALVQPLYEPLHNRLRARPPSQRAVSYAAGFLAVEYACGWILRRLKGQAPWDYSPSRWSIDGLIRLDYAPFWAAAGIALERLHDHLEASSLSA